LLAGLIPPVGGGGTCDAPEDISWASVSPSSGSTAGGDADDVTVTFDSVGLGTGVYTGTLCITSNAVLNPLVQVPLTLEVSSVGPPLIDVTPATLENTQAPDVTATLPLTVSNVGGADLNWTIDEDALPNVLYSTVTIPSAPAGTVTLGDGPFSFSSSGLPAGSAAYTLDAPEGLTTITHSASQSIVALNSVSCNDGIGHTNNSYLRYFTLADFGITDGFDVQSVDIGIEEATGAGGDQPMEVRLYTWDPSDPFIFANLTLIGSAAISLPDQSLTIVNIPVTGSVPAGGTLVVEIFTPNGQTEGNLIFVGSNPSGQTAPSYLAAADCGVPEPTDTAAIGFPGMHIVMNVTGDVVAAGGVCVNPEDISWASVSPTNGTTTSGNSDVVDVTLDSTGLGDGVYTGTLCVTSNDLTNPLVTVPLTLTVSSGGGGTFDGSATPNASIADGTYDGSLGTMACSIIDASSIPGGSTVTDVSLDLGVTHTWVGDLVTKLISPDGNILGIFSRAGFAEPLDDGTGCCGDSSGLSSSSLLSFADSFADDPETMGNTIADAQVICQDDGRCTYLANPGAVVGHANFAGFAGENASGNWQLCVGDSEALDTGTFASWTIHITYGP
jgi:subtilisin-like proprotein convertase family protein